MSRLGVVVELLPCPFCGSRASRWEYDTSRGDVFGVCCSNDDCPADVYAEGDSREAADAAWNTRAPLATGGAAWQPIETAPKDGRPVWVRGNNWGHEDGSGGHHHGWAFFEDGEWRWPGAEGGKATYLTHWFPAFGAEL